jgi:hypothetical protein
MERAGIRRKGKFSLAKKERGESMYIGGGVLVLILIIIILILILR